MRTWKYPEYELLPGSRTPLYLKDSYSQELVELQMETLRLWVCGITPYDATHLGHASTYVFFDLLARTWLDTGRQLNYAQNVTDIDDPLFERATATKVYWKDLAAEQVNLFREDMEALSVVPPAHWVSISETLTLLERTVKQLETDGFAYRIPGAEQTEDIYVRVLTDKEFTKQLPWSLPEQEEFLIEKFRDHGGDPERPHKESIFDAQLWRGVREKEFQPEDLSPGEWKPGWHLECAAIALETLGGIDIQGGGSDLAFPHHEYSESHLRMIAPDVDNVKVHLHTGMVAFRGEKMSKSLGNLVKVSELREAGVDPQLIRLVILRNHYASDWEYQEDLLRTAQQSLSNWKLGVSTQNYDELTGLSGMNVLKTLRDYLRNDLRSDQVVDYLDSILNSETTWFDAKSAKLVRNTVWTLLGIEL
ncbi:MAG: hypothetical protein SPG61_03385 [Arcanobacterium sp.]|nr:hypothetical protein [Arcanobacterium sp.]